MNPQPPSFDSPPPEPAESPWALLWDRCRPEVLTCAFITLVIVGGLGAIRGCNSSKEDVLPSSEKATQ